MSRERDLGEALAWAVGYISDTVKGPCSPGDDAGFARARALLAATAPATCPGCARKDGSHTYDCLSAGGETATPGGDREDFHVRLARARKWACEWTSRWATVACPALDGPNTHSQLCDSLTYCFDDELQRHGASLAISEGRAQGLAEQGARNLEALRVSEAEVRELRAEVEKVTRERNEIRWRMEGLEK